MNNIGFHLPHNAVLPEEVEFIIDCVNIENDYYLYDDLKAIIFEKQVQENVFEKFHKQPYQNIQNNKTLKEVYDKIKSGEKKYADIKNLAYTDRKNVNQIWNEFVRDYVEFLAFTGLMPSYYKGKSNESEKKHYIGFTLKSYKKGEITFEDILFNMKYRNASKNEEHYDAYNVRNRPFVVALKIMDMYKKKGYKEIDGRILAKIVKQTVDEDDILIDGIHPLNTSVYDEATLKEYGRGRTFLGRYFTEIFKIETTSSTPVRYNLESFNIGNYNFKEKAIYIGEQYGKLEITPNIIKMIRKPELIDDPELKEYMEEKGLIKNNEANVQFNIDTDLAERKLAIEASNDDIDLDEVYDLALNVSDVTYNEGKVISESGKGTLYEEFLNKILKNKFGENKVTYYGANTMAKRLSDITIDLDIFDGIDNRKIKVVVEAKSGSAIAALDERKEREDIINTLCESRTKYDGIWVMFVDSNSIPRSGHGGFRESGNLALSFEQKLLNIQFNIQMQTCKTTLVTAFSYEKFMEFLNNIENSETISKMQAKHFWTWSKKFVNMSFVSVHA